MANVLTFQQGGQGRGEMLLPFPPFSVALKKKLGSNKITPWADLKPMRKFPVSIQRCLGKGGKPCLAAWDQGLKAMPWRGGEGSPAAAFFHILSQTTPWTSALSHLTAAGEAAAVSPQLLGDSSCFPPCKVSVFCPVSPPRLLSPPQQRSKSVPPQATRDPWVFILKEVVVYLTSCEAREWPGLMLCPLQGAGAAKGTRGSTSHLRTKRCSLYLGTCPHHVAARGALRLDFVS